MKIQNYNNDNSGLDMIVSFMFKILNTTSLTISMFFVFMYHLTITLMDATCDLGKFCWKQYLIHIFFIWNDVIVEDDDTYSEQDNNETDDKNNK